MLGAGYGTCGRTGHGAPREPRKQWHLKPPALAQSPRSGRVRPRLCANTSLRAARTRNKAAIRAGYAPGASAEVEASRLLHNNPRVAAEIEEAQGRLLRRHELSADGVL